MPFHHEMYTALKEKLDAIVQTLKDEDFVFKAADIAALSRYVRA